MTCVCRTRESRKKHDQKCGVTVFASFRQSNSEFCSTPPPRSPRSRLRRRSVRSPRRSDRPLGATDSAAKTPAVAPNCASTILCGRRPRTRDRWTLHERRRTHETLDTNTTEKRSEAQRRAAKRSEAHWAFGCLSFGYVRRQV